MSDKYINRIKVNGVTYKLQCEITTVNPLICPKCGSTFAVNSDGVGRCDYCGTYYSAKYKLEEIK